MSGLPPHVQREISGLLAKIQSIFKPGAKVMLVVDNGSTSKSLMMGDAETSRVIALMRDLEREPPSGPRRQA